MQELSAEQKKQIEVLAKSESDLAIARKLRLDRDRVQAHLQAIGRLRRRKRERVFRALMVALPLLFFLVLELILRAFNYGGNLDLVLRKEILNKPFFVLNENVTRRYFPRYDIDMPKLQEDYFEVVKSPNTYRIFCLGGSTTAGFPYSFNATFPDLLDDRLSTLCPTKNIEVVNVGITAINSYSVLDFVKELVAYDPDLFIVYMGHNEFYGALGIGSLVQLGGGRNLTKLYLSLQEFKLFLLLRDAVGTVMNFFHESEAGLREKRTLMEAMAKNQHIPLGSKEYDAAKSYFDANLEEIIGLAQKHGAKVLVSNLVSNENAMEPFAAEFNETTSEQARKGWRENYDKGLSFEKEKNFVMALEFYRKAEAIDSNPANVHFRMGKCLEALGEYEEAKQAFVLAKDYDVVRFRASSEFNQIIHNVSQKLGAAFVDMGAAFSENSEHGIIGEELVTEHLHPNFMGYSLMAKEFTKAIAQNGLLTPKEAWHWELDKSDTEYRDMACVTPLDEMLAEIRVSILTQGWPFKEKPTADVGEYSGDEKVVFDIANQVYSKKLSWNQARYQLAQYFFEKKAYNRAETEYRAILKTVPWDYFAYIKIGDIYLIQERFDEAEKCYSSAWQYNKNSSAIYAKLGITYLMRNEFDRGRSLFEQSLALHDQGHVMDAKSQVQARYYLGVCYLKLGDQKAAQKEIQTILVTQPGHRGALELLQHLNVN